MLKVTITLIVLGILGIVFLVLGSVLIHVFTNMIHDEVADNIPLKKGSKSYKMWSDPSTPIYFQVWMFDVVNHDEIMKDGSTPVLIQKGPYTYSEKRHKFDVSFNSNGTLNYRERTSYFFEPDLSVGTENDTFMAVNLPMLTIAYLTQWESIIIKEIINLALKISGEELFLKLSVHDLMWGYKDNFLSEVNKAAKTLHINYSIPEIFGLFYNKNNSDDGLYEIYSGLDGISNFGQIVTWNEQSTLSYWNSSITNMINGSDGTIYPPFVNTADTKYLFSSDLCRSLGMEYKSKVDVRGIELDKFVAPDIMFANVTVNPYNEGFCTPPGNCLPSGLLNVSVCRSGAPVIMSMPHFLGSDDDTINSVIGLHPNREEHESYIEVEPRTGVVMNVGKKIQINTFIRNISGFTDTFNIKPVVFPIMWLNESAQISESDASDFRSQVLDKIKLTQGIQYGFIALGVLLIVIVIFVLIKRKVFPVELLVVINNEEARLLSAA